MVLLMVTERILIPLWFQHFIQVNRAAVLTLLVER